jgi:predicted AlkP superfamily phosphohydrolase/phosphomutase
VSSPDLTVIGLDSATFDVVDPMLAAGELPNLARLCDGGARGVLRSTTHPLTPHAWATIVSGVNAGRHGIWDFTERDETGYQLRLVNGSFRKAPAVWDRLSRSGRRVGIVNIPFTWPAPQVDGFSVAGFDAAAREQGLTHPESLRDELRRRYGSLELDNKFPLTDGELDLDLVRRAAAQKIEIVTWLAERFEPELLFVVFMAADHIHHLCWTDWASEELASPVAEVYRVLDEAVGALAALAGDEGNFVVISDHGAGPLQGVVNLNAWLASEGFLAYETGGGVAGRQLLGRALELRRYLPERLRYAAKQRLPGLRERAIERGDYTVLDWERTQAFAYGTFGNIVLNVRGREERGIVEPGDEYERVRDEIAARLLELTGPDGERIVAHVHRREDLFHGPELAKVPDLLVEFDRYAWLGKGNLKTRADSLWDEIEIEGGGDHSYVGSHRHEGIVALSGPAVAAGAPVGGELVDVAPTLLYLLGEAVPADLEGRVLVEALRPELLDARPPAYDDAAPAEFEPERAELEEEGAAEVERRLRGLGYLE